MTFRIPGYRILRPLAEGGMASVYLAVQESLNRPVVLKLPKAFNDIYQSARFVAEGKIIASLRHRNIITIYDIGVSGERHYFTMEYLQGGNLEDRITRGMSTDQALDLVEVIGGCLEYVHRKDIVHRDIKPANILFHRNGTPVLTDFGVAKQIESDSRLTKDGIALGSPYYISPEQAECKPLDGRADIYSLGIILYEMLTGKKPYTGSSDIQIIIGHLTDPVPSLPPELGAYQELLDRMIAKDPDGRFDSAAAMVEYLRALRNPGQSASTAPRASGFSADPRPAAQPGCVAAGGEARHAFKKINALLFDEQLLRFAGAMTILLVVALAFVKTMPLMATAFDRMLADKPATTGRTEPVPVPGNTPVAPYESYLVQAREAMEKLHYTEPSRDNAYYYYRMVLKMDPGNAEALKGISRIAEIYADLVDWARGIFEYGKAEEYLRIGLGVDPENSRLLALRKSLASR